MRSRHANRERGTTMIELAIVAPLLLVTVIATVDFGRLIYAQQVVTDLTREAGNVVSRGTSPTEAFAASSTNAGPLDLAHEGAMIITTVRRRTPSDGRPWVHAQVAEGVLTDSGSRVGRLGGPAHIPGLDSVDAGVTITAVEIYHSFDPLLRVGAHGLNFYPDVVYDVSFF